MCRCPTTAPMDARIYHLCRDPVTIFGPTRLDLTSDTGYTGGQFWNVDCGSVQVLRVTTIAVARITIYHLDARGVQGMSKRLFLRFCSRNRVSCTNDNVVIFRFVRSFPPFGSTHYILLF
eukprot:m.359502 g.359502  ORF g.359502 m.359502 type:complete len:120 (+) comp16629_c0_seq3:60-419(+)